MTLPSLRPCFAGVLAVGLLLGAFGCAPDERHDSNFYRICKDKNKSEDLAHTVQELLALVSSPSSCEQAHNYLMKTSSLSLKGKGIKALEPLSGLPQLVELNLADNPLSALTPLAGMPKLRFLNLDNTGLTSAAVEPLAGLPRLEVLHAGHNALTDLDAFATMAPLRQLFVNHNQLQATEEPVGEAQGTRGPAGLDKLDVSFNKDLKQLPAALVAAVAELNLAGVPIADLSPLAANTALRELSADDGGTITDISALAGKPHLAMVNLRGHKIKSIAPLASAAELRHLDVSFNLVASLAPLAKSHSLKALFVAGNPIANSKNQTKDNCPQGADVPEPVRTVCQQP